MDQDTERDALEEELEEELEAEFEDVDEENPGPLLLGRFYEQGYRVERDYAKALELFRQGAEQGDTECMAYLAKCLILGRGCKPDPAQGYFWAGKAAEAGSWIGKLFQGHCLLYGLGVKADDDKGTDLLWEVLNYNFPEEGGGQVGKMIFDDLATLYYDMGHAYENGLAGMPKKARLAAYYFGMLADEGHPEGTERFSHYKKVLGIWKYVK